MPWCSVVTRGVQGWPWFSSPIGGQLAPWVGAPTLRNALPSGIHWIESVTRRWATDWLNRVNIHELEPEADGWAPRVTKFPRVETRSWRSPWTNVAWGSIARGPTARVNRACWPSWGQVMQALRGKYEDWKTTVARMSHCGGWQQSTQAGGETRPHPVSRANELAINIAAPPSHPPGCANCPHLDRPMRARLDAPRAPIGWPPPT